MIKIREFIILVSCLLLSQISCSQQFSARKINKAADDKLVETILNLRHFLRLQNDGDFPEQIAQNKQWCNSVFRALKFETKTIKTEGAPLLFAEKSFMKMQKVFYSICKLMDNQWTLRHGFKPILLNLF